MPADLTHDAAGWVRRDATRGATVERHSEENNLAAVRVLTDAGAMRVPPVGWISAEAAATLAARLREALEDTPATDTLRLEDVAQRAPRAR